MGLGMFAAIKSLAPVFLYVAGVVLVFAALSGRGRWGRALLGLLIFAMMLAWIFMAMGNKIKFMEKSSLNGISILLIIYLFISLQVGNFYLHVPFLDLNDPRVQDWKNFCMMPLLYFVTANMFSDKKWIWRLFTVMCCSIFVMGYYTSTQVTWFSSLESRAKITGTFEFLGPNEVAAFFNQYTLLLMSVYFAMKKGRNKLLLAGLILVNLYCVLFIFSRAAYVGIMIGMFVLF